LRVPQEEARFLIQEPGGQTALERFVKLLRPVLNA
jgi:hypothetical protein